MRSNIARTWPASRVPLPSLRRAATGALLELREEGDDVLELFGRQVLERRHRLRRVHQRARDRLPRQPVADLRQVRPRAGVAVVADLVAGEAARLGDRRLAPFVFLERLPARSDDAWRRL